MPAGYIHHTCEFSNKYSVTGSDVYVFSTIATVTVAALCVFGLVFAWDRERESGAEYGGCNKVEERGQRVFHT